MVSSLFFLLSSHQMSSLSVRSFFWPCHSLNTFILFLFIDFFFFPSPHSYFPSLLFVFATFHYLFFRIFSLDTFPIKFFFSHFLTWFSFFFFYFTFQCFTTFYVIHYFYRNSHIFPPHSFLTFLFPHFFTWHLSSPPAPFPSLFQFTFVSIYFFFVTH